MVEAQHAATAAVVRHEGAEATLLFRMESISVRPRRGRAFSCTKRSWWASRGAKRHRSTSQTKWQRLVVEVEQFS